MDQTTALRALPYYLPEHLFDVARGCVEQVIAACELSGLAVCIETALGAWAVIVASCPDEDSPELEALRAMLAEDPDPSDATPQEVLALLDAMELLADLQASVGVGEA